MPRQRLFNSVWVWSALVIAASLGCAAAAGQAAKSDGNKKPITYESVYGPNRINLSGSYARGMTWLADGEHFLHRRDGGLQKVNARSDEAGGTQRRRRQGRNLFDHPLHAVGEQGVQRPLDRDGKAQCRQQVEHRRA